MNTDIFLTGEAISLQQMLNARDRRRFKQQKLLAAFPMTLISFTMNIAGPVKAFPLALKAYEEGKELILTQLKVFGIPVRHLEEIREHTGYEAFLSLDSDPLRVKGILADFEECHPIGRLFDIDVLRPDLSKVSREDIGRPGRTCLLCSRPAFECSRSRRHSVGELQNRTVCMLWDYFSEKFARDLSFLATRALLYEVSATPKPGLVDRHNSGAHRDMDVFTFEASSLAIQPYFKAFVTCGIRHAYEDAGKLLSHIRPIGVEAETGMRRATHGINTHKGAIFSMGILLGALGLLYGRRKPYSRKAVSDTAAAICNGLTEELKNIPEGKEKTFGEQLYREYGITGIRGEAEAGFPSLFNIALPGIVSCVRKGISLNDAGILTLIRIMAAAQDTNLIHRSSYEEAEAVRERMKKLAESPLEEMPYLSVLEELDREFISRNISPGGCADLLAAAYFFFFLENEMAPVI